MQRRLAFFFPTFTLQHKKIKWEEEIKKPRKERYSRDLLENQDPPSLPRQRRMLRSRGRVDQLIACLPQAGLTGIKVLLKVEGLTR